LFESRQDVSAGYSLSSAGWFEGAAGDVDRNGVDIESIDRMKVKSYEGLQQQQSQATKPGTKSTKNATFCLSVSLPHSSYGQHGHPLLARIDAITPAVYLYPSYASTDHFIESTSERQSS